MKRRIDWQVAVALVLISLTALFYAIHFLLFRDLRHIFLYFVGDVAFVFFEVLLITLVIHRLLHHRERVSAKKRLNMRRAVFFSEVGTELLRKLMVFEGDTARIGRQLAVPRDWSERTFLNVRESFMRSDVPMDSGKGDLDSLRQYLRGGKPLLLDLLMSTGSPEDEAFTNLVWAVFHLLQELDRQGPLDDLAASDGQHLEEDIERVYRLLVCSWMEFIQHLEANYPYLHSLAVRTNPFDDQPVAEAS